MRARIRQLGFGRKVARGEVERVCGGSSKANHFLDATTKQGLLIPIRWGEYQVADEATIDVLAKVALPLHQRFVAWAHILPRISKGTAFLAPRLWKYSDLNLEEPAPVIALEPKDRNLRPTAPQWGALQYDLVDPETWILDADGEEAAKILVPGWFDSLVLVRSNADPRWRATAAQWTDRVSAAQLRDLELVLSTMKRIPNPKRGLFEPSLGQGPPLRKRLVTPAWFENLHRDALESFARVLHG